MFILKKGHQPGVYVPLRALFLVKVLIELGALRFTKFQFCLLIHLVLEACRAQSTKVCSDLICCTLIILSFGTECFFGQTEQTQIRLLIVARGAF